MLWISRILTIISAILALAGGAYADPYVLGTYKPLPEGYVVEFTVYNPVANPVDMFGIDTGDATAICSPRGWWSRQTDRQVDWRTYELPEMIGQGKRRSGFSFITSSSPGTLGWWIHNGDGYSGKVTPTLIPEPSSLIALVAGLGALPLLRRRKH